MDDTSIKIGSFWVGIYIYIVYQQTVWLTVGISRETEASSPVKLLDRTPLTAASSPSQSHQFWDLNLQSGFIRSNKKQRFFERLNIRVFEPTKHGITWGFRALPCEKSWIDRDRGFSGATTQVQNWFRSLHSLAAVAYVAYGGPYLRANRRIGESRI